LLKEIKDINKWSNTSWPWIGRLGIIKISVFSNWSQLKAFKIKIPSDSFIKTNKLF
jgi:hypothetical protein